MGGVGFFGLYLCDCLLCDGYDVLCVDNFYIGIKCNIVYLLGYLCFEVLCYDVIFLLYVEVDDIYNLVCFVLFIYY